MDILSGATMIMLMTILVVFTYSFLSDIFSFFIAPRINERLDNRISILHKMGLYESANVLKARWVYNWWDLIR